MRLKKLLFTGLLLLAVVATPADLISQDEPRYRTFDFFDFDVKLLTEHQVNQENVEYLKAAISNQLDAHGLIQSANPDLRVNIGVVVEEEVQTRETDIREMRYIGQRSYHWEVEDVVVGVYKVGTVSVELVDSKTNKVVWSGSDANVMRKQKNIQKKIDKGAARIFRKFDVSKLGS